MKLYHLIIMFYVGFITGSLLICIFGDDGFAFYPRHTLRREVLEKNINDLKKKNEELNRNVASLKSDPEEIRVLARKLGYYKDDENIILLHNDLTPVSHYEIGALVKTMWEKTGRNIVLRITGFAISILIMTAVFILKLSRKKT